VQNLWSEISSVGQYQCICLSVQHISSRHGRSNMKLCSKQILRYGKNRTYFNITCYSVFQHGSYVSSDVRAVRMCVYCITRSCNGTDGVQQWPASADAYAGAPGSHGTADC